MARRTQRRLAACVWAALIVAGPLCRAGLADARPPTLSMGGASSAGLHPVAPRDAARRQAATGGSSRGWWLGTAGVALALAAFGALSLASRRLLPQRGQSGSLQVVGRASLSPKHTVYLLKAGDRTLIIGTGAQGAPTLLGEWSEPTRPTPPQRDGGNL